MTRRSSKSIWVGAAAMASAAVGMLVWHTGASPAEPGAVSKAGDERSPRYSIFEQEHGRSEEAARWHPPANPDTGARMSENRVVHTTRHGPWLRFQRPRHLA